MFSTMYRYPVAITVTHAFSYVSNIQFAIQNFITLLVCGLNGSTSIQN